jgi:glucosamine--fructose-6-phosphate aminotransferase (isomerizing)
MEADMSDTPRTFPHAMLREIYEQPNAFLETLAAFTDESGLRDDAFLAARHSLAGQHSMLIAASGSSRHAGIVGKFLFEELAGLPVDVEYASEYIYRTTHTPSARCVLVISQSGETADTLEALREARLRDAATIAITNHSNSTMAQLADCSLTTRAGIEKAVPATKSFTTQLLVLHLLALFAARARGRLTNAAVNARLHDLKRLPELVATWLPIWEEEVQFIASAMTDAETCLFLGRSIHFPIAREGALKLKESAYMQAEAYPTGELKHGPAALLSKNVPLIALATHDPHSPDSLHRYEKTLNLLRDMKAQGAEIVAIATEGDTVISGIVRHTIFVPACLEHIAPIFEVIPLQMFAYFTAINRGIDVDSPRNLVKAVTRE